MRTASFVLWLVNIACQRCFIN